MGLSPTGITLQQENGTSDIVKNAIHIKEQNPDADVYVLYRDIRTYGLLEHYYQMARREGVMFSRYHQDAPPEVVVSDEGIHVTFKDHALQRNLIVTADALVLSAGIRPEDTDELAGIIKLARNQDGYFMEAHVKLRPVDTPSEGIFVCGTTTLPVDFENATDSYDFGPDGGFEFLVIRGTERRRLRTLDDRPQFAGIQLHPFAFAPCHCAAASNSRSWTRTAPTIDS